SEPAAPAAFVAAAAPRGHHSGGRCRAAGAPAGVAVVLRAVAIGTPTYIHREVARCFDPRVVPRVVRSMRRPRGGAGPEEPPAARRLELVRQAIAGRRGLRRVTTEAQRWAGTRRTYAGRRPKIPDDPTSRLIDLDAQCQTFLR